MIYDYRQSCVTCTNCGVVSRAHQIQSEQDTFENSKRISWIEQVGDVPTLGTGIGSDHRSSLVRMHQRLQTPQSRRASKITNMIDNMCSDMSMTTRISDCAKRCYYQINKRHKKKTKKDELLAAVCIAIACRQTSVSRSFKELAQRCNNVTRKELGRAFKTYTRLLKGVNTHFKIEEMVPRYTSKMGMAGKEQLFCEYVVKQVSVLDIVPVRFFPLKDKAINDFHKYCSNNI